MYNLDSTELNVRAVYKRLIQIQTGKWMNIGILTRIALQCTHISVSVFMVTCHIKNYHYENSYSSEIGGKKHVLDQVSQLNEDVC